MSNQQNYSYQNQNGYDMVGAGNYTGLEGQINDMVLNNAANNVQQYIDQNQQHYVYYQQQPVMFLIEVLVVGKTDSRSNAYC